MKMTWMIPVFLLLLTTVLWGCKEAAQSGKDPATDTLTLINGVAEADVWLLPETEKNLKTTVWGTATAAGVKKDESRPLALCAPGDDGLYMFRMIDVDGFFYSADGVTLQAGWTVRITEDERHAVTLEVADESGAVVKTYEVFAAKL